jgi:hypothetical protein
MPSAKRGEIWIVDLGLAANLANSVLASLTARNTNPDNYLVSPCVSIIQLLADG